MNYYRYLISIIILAVILGRVYCRFGLNKSIYLHRAIVEKNYLAVKCLFLRRRAQEKQVR